MVNTQSLVKIALTDEQLKCLRPLRHRYFLIFEDPRLRPPVLDEMMPDLQRVIATVAQRYCDSTTPHLQFDELMGEGNLKLAELISKEVMESEKCPTRVSFFKYFKSAAANHARSRVQKYRFTEKRTGQKPPPRAQRFIPAAKPDEEEHAAQPQPEYHKNVELSLDDPDAGLQVPDHAEQNEKDDAEVNWNFGDSAAEYAHLLTPVEKLVFHEMILPSPHARCYAELDAWRKSNRHKLSLKIKFTHMAEAVGLAPELFEEAVLTIRNKIKAYRMMTEVEQEQRARRNAIVAQLKQVFGLQIPPDIDDMVVNRMITMAARDQFDKVKDNQQVAEMLTEINAKVPRTIGGGRLACYGVLYQKNCRQCNSCDLRHSCAVEAANLGLTKMVQSQRLLGAKQPRTPAFLPRTDTDSHVTSTDEAEIVSHLQETFQRAERNGLAYYYHHVGDEKKRRYIFCIERTAPLRLRFCNPSDALKKRLVGKQKTWFPRENASMTEIIALIEQHGRETFEA